MTATQLMQARLDAGKESLVPKPLPQPKRQEILRSPLRCGMIEKRPECRDCARWCG